MVNTTMSTYIMISDTMDAMSLLAARARQGQAALGPGPSDLASLRLVCKWDQAPSLESLLSL